MPFVPLCAKGITADLSFYAPKRLKFNAAEANVPQYRANATSVCPIRNHRSNIIYYIHVPLKEFENLPFGGCREYSLQCVSLQSFILPHGLCDLQLASTCMKTLH